MISIHALEGDTRPEVAESEVTLRGDIYCGLFLEPVNTDLTLQGIRGTKDRNFPMKKRSKKVTKVRASCAPGQMGHIRSGVFHEREI